jgi:MYXO-CTERM domain-containing protein
MRYIFGYPKNNQNMDGVDTMFNTWDLNITPASSDFASISDPSVSMTGMQIEGMGALGPRQADGSLPNVDFLHLTAASRMIDKGTDVGLPYVGAAPDLGAYEYGATTGGTSGSAGASGAGAGGTTGTGTGGSGSGGTGAGGTMVTGTGGRASGGTSGTGGTPASGGSTGSGGAVTGSGGSGATATGGTPGGSGGLSGATGGATGAGGATATTGSGGTASGDAGASGGCNCAIARGPTDAASLAGALGLLGLVLLRPRRRAAIRG